MKKEYQTLDEMLEAKNKSNKKIVKEKKNKKGLRKRVVALIVAGVIALNAGTAAILHHFKKNDNSVPPKPKDSISTEINDDIDDMGLELEFTTPDPAKKYGEPTGNVDVNKVVEKNDKVYVDQKSAEKSNEVGKSEIDTKGGTLEVKKDGTVVEKTIGYEIKDQKGNVVQEGNLENEDDVPKGYYRDSKTGKIIPNGYIILDSDYYNEQGEKEFSKGEAIPEETLEKVKKYYSTTKPQTKKTTEAPQTTTAPVVEETKPLETVAPAAEESTTEKSDEGVINKDGTYTIYGTTYLTKADFEQCILNDFEGYGLVDGIVRPVDQTKVNQKSK